MALVVKAIAWGILGAVAVALLALVGGLLFGFHLDLPGLASVSPAPAGGPNIELWFSPSATVGLVVFFGAVFWTTDRIRRVSRPDRV